MTSDERSPVGPRHRRRFRASRRLTEVEDVLDLVVEAEPPDSGAVRLDMPAEGVPDVVVDQDALDEAILALGAGSGPVAIDAERASGYRYGQRA